MPLLPVPKQICYNNGFADAALLNPSSVHFARRDGIHSEGYVLDISPDGASLAFSGEAGRFYGLATLRQLTGDAADGRVPCQTIEDAPDFEARGVMLDISRDKVMTLESIKELVDLFAQIKINQLQLYVEGYSYAYKSYAHCFPQETPLTPDEIRELDAYCRERFIELVPNQNTLGHMTAWLALPEFKHLRESDEGLTLMGRTMPPSTLEPGNEEARRLVSTLTDELLESFTSAQYNAGLDEPFELGRGKSRAQVEALGLDRVYADYVNFIYGTAKAHHKQMMMWADIVSRHPEALAYIPKDITLLEWGYEANHPFKKNCEALRKAGFAFYVCPGTSAWTTFTGRTDNMLANIKNAAVNGKACGAKGLLVTDWGDGGHVSYVGVSYAGYCCGAALAWNADSAGKIALEAFLNRQVFMDARGVMGGLALDAGRYNRLEDFPMFNMTLSNLMVSLGPIPKTHFYGMLENTGKSVEAFMGPEAAKAFQEIIANRRPFDYQAMMDYFNELKDRLDQTDIRRSDSAVLLDEYRNNLRMAELGVKIRQMIETEDTDNPTERDQIKSEARTLTALIQSEHRRLWLLRNKPGGLERSVAPFARLEGMFS